MKTGCLDQATLNFAQGILYNSCYGKNISGVFNWNKNGKLLVNWTAFLVSNLQHMLHSHIRLTQMAD